MSAFKHSDDVHYLLFAYVIFPIWVIRDRKVYRSVDQWAYEFLFISLAGTMNGCISENIGISVTRMLRLLHCTAKDYFPKKPDLLY